MCKWTLVVITGLTTACLSDAIDATSPEVEALADDTWTWLPIAGTKCGSGTQTGIAVNPHAGSDRLTVYLQGGGACFTAEQCGTPTDPPLVYHLDGYDETTFKTDLMAGRYPADYQVFDRADADSPFADDNFVFVPYCTGDVHSGSHVQRYREDLTVHHVGFDNVGFDLPAIQRLFPDPARLVVTGSSAGGLGAVFNYERFREAWPAARAFLIDDAGQPLPDAWAWYTAQDAAWHNFGNFPEFCRDCATPEGRPHRLFAFLAERPELRASLLSSNRDRFMTQYYGLPPAAQDNAACQSGGPCEFERRLQELAAELAQGAPGVTHVFVPESNQHGFLPSRFDTVAAGVPLRSFLAAQLADSADFRDAIEPRW